MSQNTNSTTDSKTDSGPRLSPEHREFLRARAVADDLARERGYRTIDVKARLADKGFSPVQRLVPGLLIPLFNARGECVRYQLRPDQPRERQGKIVKYESPSKSRPVVDIPKRLSRPRKVDQQTPFDPAELLPPIQDVEVPLLVTEGPLKADAATGIGLCSIALQGVSAWHRVPDWNDFPIKGRDVLLAFDSDAMQKRAVWDQLRALKEWLESHGASVKVIYLPPAEYGSKTGLDDFIAAAKATGRTDEEVRSELLTLASDELIRPAAEAREDRRPEITIVAGEAPAIVDVAERVLAAHAPRLQVFQRAGEVVRIIALEHETTEGDLWRPAGIATGRRPAATGVPKESEELRKAITSALRENQPVVNLDNITRPVDSPDLARAITQGEYQDRLLGANRMLLLPTNILWTATGNNLVLHGDMTSRAVICRIDPRVEFPEDRIFEIWDLPSHLLSHRKALVAAALTILRAYHVAGRPKQDVKPWGGFDQWSREIREPLVWLGEVDPCQTRESIVTTDPDREAHAEVLRTWHAAFGEREMLLRAAIAEVGSAGATAAETEQRQALKRALLAIATKRDDSDAIELQRLGTWLSSKKDRIVDGFRLNAVRKLRHATVWKVSLVSPMSPKATGPERRKHACPPAGSKSDDFSGVLGRPAKDSSDSPDSRSGIATPCSKQPETDSPDSPSDPENDPENDEEF